MSSDVQLRPADIKARLRQLLAKGGARPIALYGRGEAGEVEVEEVRWQVRPARSELELRAALAKAEATSPLVLLVDYADDLPLDVSCRLAGMKVHPVDRRTRLANLFGAREVAPGFASTALAEVLLQDLPALEPITGTLLQPPQAWLRYLHVRLGLDLTGELSLDKLLLRAFEHPEAGRQFAASRDDRIWRQLLEEARGFWGGVGPAAQALWQAWMEGQPESLAAWTVLIDAARRSGDPGSIQALRLALQYSQGAQVSWLEEVVAEPLCRAVNDFLPRRSPGELKAFLNQVGQRQPAEQFDAARRASPWLPEGFAALEEELAQALLSAVHHPERVEAARGAFDALGNHHQARADKGALAQHALREHALRLATWLAWAPLLPELRGNWEDLAQLARWYDREGGWVDWSREALRSWHPQHTALEQAVRALLERVDGLRRELDRRFAQALGWWHEAGRPSLDVLPIDAVTREVVAPFLEGAGRRLLIVLLDGMSVSVATRLLEARQAWAPVHWRPGKREAMPPAIAAVPSLTATSRGAFFAGKASRSFGDEAEYKDLQRFASNPYLQDFTERGEGPRLFLKASMAGGKLSPELAQAIGDKGERVVAVVVNAVDEQLKGSDQLSPPYEELGAIPLLENLLQACQVAERAVLLTSDHGHVPAQTLSHRSLPPGSLEGGQRWRRLGEGEGPLEGEVALPEGCWSPRGAAGVALLWDERHTWGQAAHGAHGGASMAELVVPLRLVAPNWLAKTHQPPDYDLETREQERPRWWGLNLPKMAPPPQARPEPEPPLQASLFEARPQALPPSKTLYDKVALAPEEPHPLRRTLEKSHLFEALCKGASAEQVERALTAIDALLKADKHSLSREDFARRLSCPPRSVTRRVADLGFLNADGYAIVEEDKLSQQVRLNLDIMKIQYGLPS